MRYILLFLPVWSMCLHAQTTCTVWQWTDGDSTSKTISEIDSLNPQGMMVRSVMTNCRMQSYTVPDQVNISVYRDTFLVSWTSTTLEGDSMRIVSEYDDAGRCIHENEYRFRHVEADRGTTGMFTFTDANHDTTEGKWTLLTKGTYTYNQSGQKVMFIALAPDGHESAKETWTYNKRGQIASHESYVSGEMYKKEDYSYFKGGYSIKMVLYEDGKPRNELPKDSAMYRTSFTTIYKLDNKGRKMEVKVMDDDKQKQKSRYTMSYNSEGKLVRDMFYDAEDLEVVGHEYVYR